MVNGDAVCWRCGSGGGGMRSVHLWRARAAQSAADGRLWSVCSSASLGGLALAAGDRGSSRPDVDRGDHARRARSRFPDHRGARSGGRAMVRFLHGRTTRPSTRRGTAVDAFPRHGLGQVAHPAIVDPRSIARPSGRPRSRRGMHSEWRTGTCPCPTTLRGRSLSSPTAWPPWRWPKATPSVQRCCSARRRQIRDAEGGSTAGGDSDVPATPAGRPSQSSATMRSTPPWPRARRPASTAPARANVSRLIVAHLQIVEVGAAARPGRG